jgi:hypothetical protein
MQIAVTLNHHLFTGKRSAPCETIAILLELRHHPRSSYRGSLHVHTLVNFDIDLKTLLCNGKSGGQGLLIGTVGKLSPCLVASPQGWSSL